MILLRSHDWHPAFFGFDALLSVLRRQNHHLHFLYYYTMIKFIEQFVVGINGILNEFPAFYSGAEKDRPGKLFVKRKKIC
jgi:hypothetical protein